MPLYIMLPFFFQLYISSRVCMCYMPTISLTVRLFQFFFLKGVVEIKKYIFSVLFWFELLPFGDNDWRYGCFFFIVEKTKKTKQICDSNATTVSLYRSHDPITRESPQTLFWPVRGTVFCLSTEGDDVMCRVFSCWSSGVLTCWPSL